MRAVKFADAMLFLSTLSLRRATLIPITGFLERVFLSTLSLRRATGNSCTQALPEKYFYPRSPCGERLPEKSESLTTYFISIHALLAESDRVRQGDKLQNRNFYPRSPCGERPTNHEREANNRTISIHALLAESDNARPETHRRDAISIHALLAESDETTPCRVAETLISIHALLAESDLKGFAMR